MINTNLKRYGTKWVFNNSDVKEKIFNTMFKKYGCKYALQNKELYYKMINSYDIEKGYKNALIIRNYKDTNLYYQGSYEYDFLELCENKGIINEIENGNSYNYIPKHKKHGHRLLTDFSYNNYEIEIKSTYILEKQGGEDKINAKRDSVIYNGVDYILILDKNYEEFLRLI